MAAPRRHNGYRKQSGLDRPLIGMPLLCRRVRAGEKSRNFIPINDSLSRPCHCEAVCRRGNFQTAPSRRRRRSIAETRGLERECDVAAEKSYSGYHRERRVAHGQVRGGAHHRRDRENARSPPRGFAANLHGGFCQSRNTHGINRLGEHMKERAGMRCSYSCRPPKPPPVARRQAASARPSGKRLRLSKHSEPGVSGGGSRVTKFTKDAALSARCEGQ